MVNKSSYDDYDFVALHAVTLLRDNIRISRVGDIKDDGSGLRGLGCRIILEPNVDVG